MKELQLHSTILNTVVEVPISFIDTHLQEATGLGLKVYLYLLRAVNAPHLALSVDLMADLFKVSREEIVMALGFWASRQMLSLEFESGELSGITLRSSDGAVPAASFQTAASVAMSSAPAAAEVPPVSPQKPAAKESKRHAPLPQNVQSLPEREAHPDALDALYEDEHFLELLSLLDHYYAKLNGRPAPERMKEALGRAYLILNRDADMTEYLMEYCLDESRFVPSRLEKTAEGWQAEGLNTLSLVKSGTAKKHRITYQILNALGITGRGPTPSELAYITDWRKDFDHTLVIEACARTIGALHRPDFNYVSGILDRWKAAGVQSLQDVAALDRAHEEKKEAKKQSNAAEPKCTVRKSRFRNYDERDIDYDALFAGSGN